jgi:hypothetical protein
MVVEAVVRVDSNQAKVARAGLAAVGMLEVGIVVLSLVKMVRLI